MNWVLLEYQLEKLLSDNGKRRNGFPELWLEINYYSVLCYVSCLKLALLCLVEVHEVSGSDKRWRRNTRRRRCRSTRRRWSALEASGLIVVVRVAIYLYEIYLGWRARIEGTRSLVRSSVIGKRLACIILNAAVGAVFQTRGITTVEFESIFQAAPPFLSTYEAIWRWRDGGARRTRSSHSYVI